jgi:putative membrane protein
VTKDVGLSVVAPLGVALGCLAVRLVQRIDVLPVLGGLLGIAASALWAWRTGRASDYFTLGLMTNAAYLAGLLLSLAVRWPALGLLIGFARGDATGWRSGGSDDRRATRRRYAVITWMWAGLFAARLAVQTPLYYTDATEALAVVRLIMGPPVYALLAWFTWLLVRGLPPVPARRAAGRDGEG